MPAVSETLPALEQRLTKRLLAFTIATHARDGPRGHAARARCRARGEGQRRASPSRRGAGIGSHDAGTNQRTVPHVAPGRATRPRGTCLVVERRDAPGPQRSPHFPGAGTVAGSGADDAGTGEHSDPGNGSASRRAGSTRLLDFERLGAAWPRGRTAIERAEIGRQRGNALSKVAALRGRIVTAQTEPS